MRSRPKSARMQVVLDTVEVVLALHSEPAGDPASEDRREAVSQAAADPSGAHASPRPHLPENHPAAMDKHPTAMHKCLQPRSRCMHAKPVLQRCLHAWPTARLIVHYCPPSAQQEFVAVSCMQPPPVLAAVLPRAALAALRRGRDDGGLPGAAAAAPKRHPGDAHCRPQAARWTSWAWRRAAGWAR